MNQPKLWYRSPASCFEEALPIGAGRFGAMLYGSPECEYLQLNEDSVWSGGLRSRVNPDAKQHYPEVRRLIMEGHIAEAEALAFQTMQGCPPNMRHYMPLGDLSVRLDLPEGEITDYCRMLELGNAVYAVSFRKGDAVFHREVFASYPAQCIVMHLTGTVPFSVSALMDGRDDYYDNNCILNTEQGLSLIFDGGSGAQGGIHFCATVRAVSATGTVSHRGNTLTVQQATDVTLFFSTHTNYYHPDADLQQLTLDVLDAAIRQPYDMLRAAHLADHQALFDRVSLQLPDQELAEELPTDQLLEAVKNGDLHALNAVLALYFHFGRYLMIAGSRPGSLPLNLQGIWNPDMWPAWGSRFTININTEMNYWPAESCNLPECHLPLFDLLKKVMENGKQTAQDMYGLHGFCCHHNTDLWGDTAPQDLWMPATIWPMGGAWLALHIMEHYRYTLDRDFLAANFEVLYQAALFFTEYLTENAQGQLVTCPSVSPENTYQLPDGEKGCLCSGPSMDSQIITELYNAVIEADHILAANCPIVPTLKAQLKRLPQPKIGKYGQIMEWAVDYDETEPGHRHISQLFALHPAHQISPRKTPELARAAAATLQRRLQYGGGHTGWSCAWIVNMYARLHDGADVYMTLQKLMQNSTNPNLFDMHPPFQIDGNFGGAAAIAEALLQSDADGIILLPACPAAWENGAFHGLCAYGGFVISAVWECGLVKSVTVYAKQGGICRIYVPEGSRLMLNGADLREEAADFMEFETVPQGEYHLTAI